MGNDLNLWVYLPASPLRAVKNAQALINPEAHDIPDRSTDNHGLHDPPVPAAPPPSPKSDECRSAQADFSVTPDGRLSMFFPFDGMTKQTAMLFFESGFFELPEPFELPGPLLARLARDVSPVIAAGLYPVSVTDTGYSVVF